MWGEDVAAEMQRTAGCDQVDIHELEHDLIRGSLSYEEELKRRR